MPDGVHREEELVDARHIENAGLDRRLALLVVEAQGPLVVEIEVEAERVRLELADAFIAAVVVDVDAPRAVDDAGRGDLDRSQAQPVHLGCKPRREVRVLAEDRPGVQRARDRHVARLVVEHRLAAAADRLEVEAGAVVEVVLQIEEYRLLRHVVAARTARGVARRRLIVIVVLRAAGLVVLRAGARRHAGQRQVVAELERPDVRAVVREGPVPVREPGRRGDDQALRRRLRAEHVRHRDALRDARRCRRGDPGRVAHETPVLPPVFVEAIARGADLLDLF